MKLVASPRSKEERTTHKQNPWVKKKIYTCINSRERINQLRRRKTEQTLEAEA